MTDTLEYLEHIRKGVSDESFNTRKFKRELDLLNSDEDVNNLLDTINNLRVRINHLIEVQSSCCKEMQTLTWDISPINDETLRRINDIIASGRNLADILDKYAKEYKSLADKNVLKSEIDELFEVNEHWKEVMDDLEDVYFNLPDSEGFKDSTIELESL